MEFLNTVKNYAWDIGNTLTLGGLNLIAEGLGFETSTTLKKKAIKMADDFELRKKFFAVDIDSYVQRELDKSNNPNHKDGLFRDVPVQKTIDFIGKYKEVANDKNVYFYSMPEYGRYFDSIKDNIKTKTYTKNEKRLSGLKEELSVSNLKRLLSEVSYENASTPISFLDEFSPARTVAGFFTN